VNNSVVAFSKKLDEALTEKECLLGEKWWLASNHTVRHIKDELTIDVRKVYDAFDNCEPEALAEAAVNVAILALTIHSKLNDQGEDGE
tara:strand:- start:123 stop:386 length:264 start_codon:yes stop_codon:yes gene_type:complete